MTVMDKFAEQWKKLRTKVQASIDAEDDKPPAKWKKDSFWLYRWWMDFKYKRVGLTIISWEGEDYGYRMDVTRIPKTQLDQLRTSTPWPCHKSNCGWNEWIMIQDPQMTPFPVVTPDERGFYPPTAIDLYLYFANKDLDRALTYKKKNDIPIDGKMLALCAGAIAVCAFIMLGMFS